MTELVGSKGSWRARKRICSLLFKALDIKLLIGSLGRPVQRPHYLFLRLQNANADPPDCRSGDPGVGIFCSNRSLFQSTFHSKSIICIIPLKGSFVAYADAYGLKYSYSILDIFSSFLPDSKHSLSISICPSDFLFASARTLHLVQMRFRPGSSRPSARSVWCRRRFHFPERTASLPLPS